MQPITHLLRLPLASVCATLAAVSSAGAQTQPPLQYHVAQIIPKFVDEGTAPQAGQGYSRLSYTAVNGQGYLLCNYLAPNAPKTQPLIYLGNGRYVLLTANGLDLTAPTSQNPAGGNVIAGTLSDVAADGSFRVVGSFNEGDSGSYRSCAWSVSGSGVASDPVALKRLVLPPNSAQPGEQGEADVYSVNSAGLAVGSGNSYLLTEPLYWNLPAPDATVAPQPDNTYTGSLAAVDELGNYVGSSSNGDPFSQPTFNGTVIPVPFPSSANDPQGDAYCVNNGFAGGDYDPLPYDPSGQTGETLPFVYYQGVVTTLPCVQTSGPASADATVEQINAAGDAFGSDRQASSVNVLWKRQPDGSYLEYAVGDIAVTQNSNALILYINSSNAELNGSISGWRLLDDGSLVVSDVTAQFLATTQLVDGFTVILKPGAGTTHAPLFTGEAALGNGAYYLAFPDGDPFGYYSYLQDSNYLYHFDLGYEYVFDAADGKNGAYLYDFKSNDFFYTSPGFPFPYLYDFTLNSVVYYYPDPNNAGRYNTDGVRYFYVFGTGQIISK